MLIGEASLVLVLAVPVPKTASGIVPTVIVSVLAAVYEPAVALKTRLAMVPFVTSTPAVMLKLRLVVPPAEMAEKLAVPVLTVIPGVEHVRVALPEGEAARPLLLNGMETVAVSPGSRRPLLFPVRSEMLMLPKAITGALSSREKL